MYLIDSVLNKITMYRLVVYGLATMAVITIFMASISLLYMNPFAMIIELVLLALTTFLTEFIFAKVWQRPFNAESWLITALIIFFIFPAPKTFCDALVIMTVGIISSASKYLISWKGKHIFNPAAIAVGIVGIIGIQTATWWIGNSSTWPLTIILGLLVVRKIRRFTPVIAFGFVALLFQGMIFIADNAAFLSNMKGAVIASPLIFLASIMLTEPATMPSRRMHQIIFSTIIAILYVGGWKVGPVTIYPEIALLIGNIYAFIVSPKVKVRLQLSEIQKISEQVYNYVFVPEKRFNYKAGQYMEWTLPHVAFDSRGNRRSFTIASSPTENTIQLGVKFYNPSSTYKYALSRMEPGDYIYAGQLSGDFTLNRNIRKKLVFIAGGIGITPFRSMVKYITDNKINVDLVLMYSVGKVEEFAYLKEFEEAKNYGVKLIKMVFPANSQVDNDVIYSPLSAQLIREQVPDYSTRVFYISGPNAMVDASKEYLSELQVPRVNIKTDHFSGY